MSKASEYAERVKILNKSPEPFLIKRWARFGAGLRDRHAAFVCDNGALFITSNELTPSEAINLADWILLTFGEKKHE